MSSFHDDRRERADRRNEFALRRARDADGLLGPYLSPIRGELHRLMLEEPALVNAGADVLFARMVVPETAPDYASVLRRAAYAVLLVRAVDREETADPFTGDAA